MTVLIQRLLAATMVVGFSGLQIIASSPANGDRFKLSREQASTFARIALACIEREVPHTELPPTITVELLPNHPGRPRLKHPAFFGCYDWHSAVHNHWLLVRVLRTFPDLPEATAIRSALKKHLSAQNLQMEAEFLARPENRSFERPYGWAWVLQLASELHDWNDVDGKTWAKSLKPLADVIVKRFVEYLPTLKSPNRSGLHGNTAFALTLAYDYALTTKHDELRRLTEERSRAYFENNFSDGAAREPGSSDFLSPTLVEAELMRRVLSPEQYQPWLQRLLPGLEQRQPKRLFEPVQSHNHRDPQVVHLEGLNLSRAWCLRGVASTMKPTNSHRAILLDASAQHAAEALPHIASGEYMGEHWLPSFAVYLLTMP